MTTFNEVLIIWMIIIRNKSHCSKRYILEFRCLKHSPYLTKNGTGSQKHGID